MKKLLCYLLSFVLMLTVISTEAYALNFSDMPDDWSTEALNKAVENGLLKGSGGKIAPDDTLTRSQMAAIINRALKASARADLSAYDDIAQDQWYFDDLSIAVKIGTLKGYGSKMEPNQPITHEQAYAVLARAFKLSNGKASTLNAYTDAKKVSNSIVKDVAAMVEAGYLNGLSSIQMNRLKPQEPITRAEFAFIMNNMVSQYITNKATYSNKTYVGSVVVNTPGVVLKNVTIDGNLIIADGVGRGELTLDIVKVKGNTVVRGGGENSIILKGDCEIPNMIISTVNGTVSIKALGGAQVEAIYVDDGCDDVIITGKVQNLTIGGGVVVKTSGADIGNVNIKGGDSIFSVDAKSKVKNLSVEADHTILDINGAVSNIKISKDLVDVGLNIGKDASVQNIDADKSKIQIKDDSTPKSSSSDTSPTPSPTSTPSPSSTPYPGTDPSPTSTPTAPPTEEEDPSAGYTVSLETSYPDNIVVTLNQSTYLAGDTVEYNVSNIPQDKYVITWLENTAGLGAKSVNTKLIGNVLYCFTDMPTYNVVIKAQVHEYGSGGGHVDSLYIQNEIYSDERANVNLSYDYTYPLNSGGEVTVYLKKLPSGKKIKQITITDTYTKSIYDSNLLIGTDTGEGAGRTFLIGDNSVRIGFELEDVHIQMSTPDGKNVVKPGDTVEIGTLFQNTDPSVLTPSSIELSVEGFEYGYGLSSYACLSAASLQPDTRIVSGGALTVSLNETPNKIIRVKAQYDDGFGNVFEDFLKLYVSDVNMHKINLIDLNDLSVNINYRYPYSYDDDRNNNTLYKVGEPVTLILEKYGDTSSYIQDILIYKKGEPSVPVPVTTFIHPVSVCYAEIQFNMPDFEIEIMPVQASN